MHAEKQLISPVWIPIPVLSPSVSNVIIVVSDGVGDAVSASVKACSKPLTTILAFTSVSFGFSIHFELSTGPLTLSSGTLS